MARARNIKPGFFKNELLAEMPPETRLLFMGLWCLADREGRFEDRPKKIKMELFPCDNFIIEDSLAALAKDGFLLRYEVDGMRYAQVVNFTKHQMPHHKEVPSEIPAPPGFAQVTKHSYDVSKEVREQVFARDNFACLKCGTKDGLSLDHIVPLASGGDNSKTNLQTLCKSCNSSKGNTTKDHRQSNIDATLIQQQNNDGARCPSDSLIPDSLIPDSLIPDSSSLRSERAGAKSAPRPSRPKRDEVTLTDYLESCKADGRKPIPSDHSIRPYCADAGITDEMLQVAWLVFKDRHLNAEKTKKYKDWPGTFANSVKGRWYSLWFIGTDGLVAWTSTGLQEKTVLDARMKAREVQHEPA